MREPIEKLDSNDIKYLDLYKKFSREQYIDYQKDLALYFYCMSHLCLILDKVISRQCKSKSFLL